MTVLTPGACTRWGTITRTLIGYRVAVHSNDGTRLTAWAVTLQGASRKLVAFTR